MSYCRTSSDNWKSDLYVIGTCRYGTMAWNSMVAHNRSEGPGTPVVPLNHPLAGFSHLADTKDECVLFLLQCRDSGLHVPQSAILRLLEEMCDDEIEEPERPQTRIV